MREANYADHNMRSEEFGGLSRGRGRGRVREMG